MNRSPPSRSSSPRTGAEPTSPVVTGDFNAWPDSDEIRLFGGYKTSPAVPGQVFLDAWEYADPTAPWATWDPANAHVGPHSPAVRIDYVHVGPPGPGGLGHVRSVRRAGDAPVDGVWPSDHAAVVADLSLPRAVRTRPEELCHILVHSRSGDRGPTAPRHLVRGRTAA